VEKISANNSFYQLSAPHRQPTKPLKHKLKSVDICIIGAGYTGLSAALELAGKGYSVVVLEAEYVGFGASGRNGGQIASGFAPGMIDTAKIVGEPDAQQLWFMAEAAKNLLYQRIEKYKIDCDLVVGEMMCAAKPRHFPQIEAEAEFCRRNYGYDQFEICDKAILSSRIGTDKYYGGLLDFGGGHLDPVRYVRGLADATLAAGVDLYEKSKVTDFKVSGKITVTTDQGQVICQNLVIAANVYTDTIARKLSARFMPVGTYILATEPLGADFARELIPENFCVNDTKNILDYYRFLPDGRLLYGGRDSAVGTPLAIAYKLKKLMIDTYPKLKDAKIDYVWGGKAAVTLNRLPDIGRIGANVYYAQGFSGQGVTLTGMAGKVIADAIAVDTEKLDVFSRIPHKVLPGGRFVQHSALRLALFWYQLCDLI
jgi:gamma-glutamylputrescine oxidase